MSIWSTFQVSWRKRKCVWSPKHCRPFSPNDKPGRSFWEQVNLSVFWHDKRISNLLSLWRGKWTVTIFDKPIFTFGNFFVIPLTVWGRHSHTFRQRVRGLVSTFPQNRVDLVESGDMTPKLRTKILDRRISKSGTHGSSPLCPGWTRVSSVRSSPSIGYPVWGENNRNVLDSLCLVNRWGEC